MKSAVEFRAPKEVARSTSVPTEARASRAPPLFVQTRVGQALDGGQVGVDEFVVVAIRGGGQAVTQEREIAERLRVELGRTAPFGQSQVRREQDFGVGLHGERSCRQSTLNDFWLPGRGALIF